MYFKLSLTCAHKDNILGNITTFYALLSTLEIKIFYLLFSKSAYFNKIIHVQLNLSTQERELLGCKSSTNPDGILVNKIMCSRHADAIVNIPLKISTCVSLISADIEQTNSDTTISNMTFC